MYGLFMLASLIQALGATHTSVNVATGTFLDLLSSPAEMGYFEAIASEAASVFQNEEDFENLASLHKLSRIDSAIRESARLSPLTGRGMMQEVVHKNGVTLPNGQKIPYGAWLGISLTGISQDERFYPDPHKYDPFRFSRARTEVALMDEMKKTEVSKEAVGEKINGTVHDKPNGSWLSTTTEDFGTFGFGRHSWYVFFILFLLCISFDTDAGPEPPSLIPYAQSHLPISVLTNHLC